MEDVVERKAWTYEDYFKFDDDKRYEVMKGSLKVIPSPFDVIPSEDIVVQPDKEGSLFGTPNLIVEIVSPSTTRRDTVVKKEIYENFGVKEYWIVYPDEKAIEVWVLGDKGKYELYSFAEKEGKVKSKVLEGLEIDLKEVFG
ncbi:MAG: Uma2 family endonuclease [candidate division WOR-3 bacterium]